MNWIGRFLFVSTVFGVHQVVIEGTATQSSDQNIAIAFSFLPGKLPPSPDGATIHFKDVSEEHSILFVSCYVSEQLEGPSGCCQATKKGIQHLQSQLQKKDDGSIIRPLLNLFSRDQCQQEGSMVPAHVRDNHNWQMKFTFYAGSVPQALSNGVTYLWNSKFTIGAWQTEVQEFLDGATGNNDEHPPPQWLEPFLQNSQSRAQATTTTSDNTPRLKAFFESSLSQSGGLHRSLHHHLQLPVPATGESLPMEPDEIWMVSASFLLMVPRDMFMDVEDAFENHDWKVHLKFNNNKLMPWSMQNHSLSLETYQNAVIDIEQPAFDSPQHTVLVTLQWEGQPTVEMKDLETHQELILDLQFTSKLHLRYPSPSQAGSSTLYQPVFLLEPRLLAGQLEQGKLSKFSQPDTGTGHLELQAHAIYRSGDAPFPSTVVLTTWVAAGVQEDFAWVASFTVFTSLVGALYLTYEISQWVNRAALQQQTNEKIKSK